MKAFSGIGSLSAEEHAKTWFIRILINESYQMIRKNGSTIPMEDVREFISKDQTEPDYSDLYEAVDHLPEDEQLAVNLFYMAGYRISEIAAMCSIPENTVKSRQKRAQEKEEIGTITLSDQGATEGILCFVPDLRHFKVDVTISAGGSKMSFQTDVLEGVKSRKNYGLASAGIPDSQKISAGEEEAVLAMYYGENGVGAVPAEELLEGQAPDADYTYLYTLKFSR